MTTTTAPTTTTAAAHALTVNADALTRVLRITAHGLLKGTRGGLPVHRGVQLTVTPDTTPGATAGDTNNGGTLTLTTFNGQTSVRASLPVDQPAPGPDAPDAAAPEVCALPSVLVEHAHLRAALKGLHRSAHVALHLTEHGATITTPAGTFTLPRIGDGVFPNLPAPVLDRSDSSGGSGALALFVVPAADLAAGIKAVNRSACTDMTLPILCGLAVHAVPGEPVTVSATDRYRYTRWTTGAAWYGPELARPRIVLPARPVAAVCAALPRQLGPGAPVTLAVDADAAAGTGEGGGDGWATLTAGTGTGRVSATFAVIDGEYPRVEALWPAEVSHTLMHTVQVPAAPLAAAARQLDALQEKNRPVALHLPSIRDAEAVTVTTDPGALPDPATGEVLRQAVRVELPGTADGNRVDLDTPVGLSPAFLADALDSFPGTVTLAGINPIRPWTFTDDGPVRVLLMPVKLTAPEEPADTPAEAPAPAD